MQGGGGRRCWVQYVFGHDAHERRIRDMCVGARRMCGPVAVAVPAMGRADDHADDGGDCKRRAARRVCGKSEIAPHAGGVRSGSVGSIRPGQTLFAVFATLLREVKLHIQRKLHEIWVETTQLPLQKKFERDANESLP